MLDHDAKSAPSASTPSWRLRAYPVALLVGLGIALIVMAIAANNSDAPAATVGGDFPAFYGAALIAADGDWDNLYDFDRQVEAQADLQESAESARYFAYPPQVALAHAPLASLNYGAAYVVYSAVMLALLVAAIWLAEPMLPWLRGRRWLMTVVALSFWPMLRAVTGGSNTAITVFVIVAAWRLIEEDREIAAGLVLALLLAKPQLAVPLVGLMLVIGLYRVVVGASIGAVAFYLSGVPLGGLSWPLDWWDTATTFGRIDSEVNGYSSVSWLGFLENALGVGDVAAVTVGWGLAVLTSLALVWIWRRYAVAGRAKNSLGTLLAVAMPGILLLSPHALSHDTAIILVTLAVLHSAGQLPRWLLGTVWALALSQQWIRTIGFSPGFFMLLLVGWWVVTRLVLADGSESGARIETSHQQTSA
ncbi:MAG: glycosyltransferase family 87 protein [Acidimicrobiia bacterium]